MPKSASPRGGCLKRWLLRAWQPLPTPRTPSPHWCSRQPAALQRFSVWSQIYCQKNFQCFKCCHRSNGLSGGHAHLCPPSWRHGFGSSLYRLRHFSVMVLWLGYHSEIRRSSLHRQQHVFACNGFAGIRNIRALRSANVSKCAAGARPRGVAARGGGAGAGGRQSAPAMGVWRRGVGSTSSKHNPCSPKDLGAGCS